MTSKFRIRDASGWTMFIFGVLAMLLGLVGLLRPEYLLTLLGFTVLDRAARTAGDYTLVFLIASSMASFNMGAYCILAALNGNKQFYRWTVPFRCITPTVFTTGHPLGFVFESLTRPFYGFFRRFVPPIGSIDLSPLFVLVIAQVLLIVLDGAPRALLLGG